MYGFKNNEENTRFHAAQAIVIGLGYILLSFARRFVPIPFLGTAIWIIYLISIVFGIIKACNEEDPELPVIGGIAKSIFGTKIEG